MKQHNDTHDLITHYSHILAFWKHKLPPGKSIDVYDPRRYTAQQIKDINSQLYGLRRMIRWR